MPLAGAEGPRTLGGRRGGNGRNRTTRPRPAADQTELSLALSATCPVVIACNAVAPNQRTAVLRTRMAISWALTTVLRSRWQSRRAWAAARPAPLNERCKESISELFLASVKEFAYPRIQVVGLLVEEPEMRDRAIRQTPILGTVEDAGDLAIPCARGEGRERTRRFADGIEEPGFTSIGSDWKLGRYRNGSSVRLLKPIYR